MPRKNRPNFVALTKRLSQTPPTSMIPSPPSELARSRSTGSSSPSRPRESPLTPPYAYAAFPDHEADSSWSPPLKRSTLPSQAVSRPTSALQPAASRWRSSLLAPARSTPSIPATDNSSARSDSTHG